MNFIGGNILLSSYLFGSERSLRSANVVGGSCVMCLSVPIMLYSSSEGF